MSKRHQCMRPARSRSNALRLRQQHGVVLICALVCLSVATALVVTTVHQSLGVRRQGRMQWQLRQTEYLVDAGIRRAVARLGADEDYAGETWHPAAALPDFASVAVEIDVMPLDEVPPRWEVTVVAKLSQSDSLAFRTQRSQTFLYPLAAQAESSNPE